MVYEAALVIICSRTLLFEIYLLVAGMDLKFSEQHLANTRWSLQFVGSDTLTKFIKL